MSNDTECIIDTFYENICAPMYFDFLGEEESSEKRDKWFGKRIYF